MAINRHYRPAEQVIMDDWFQPPLEMLNLGLQSAQGQQDEAKGMLAKIGETQFQHLKGDSERAERAYSEIFQNIDRLAQGAMGEGDLRTVKADIDAYQRDLKRRFRPEGDIGKMQANYAAFMKWNEELGKMVGKEIGKGGITADHAKALRAKVLNDYSRQGGIGDRNPLTGFQNIGLLDAAMAIDENKLVEEYGKGYIADSFDGVTRDAQGNVTGGAMWRDKGKIWRKTSQGIKEVKEADVFRDLLSAIVNHEGYTQYQQQLQDLGMSKYGAADFMLRDENGDLVLDEQGEATMDKNHPIVAAAMRGASKFGFRQINYDDDIKFDPYDLAYYKHGLRMKEEKLKGQMLVYQTNALNRTLKSGDIINNRNNLSQTIAQRESMINKLKKQLEGTSDPTEQASLQSDLNAAIQAQNKDKSQLRNANLTLEKMSAAGGINLRDAYQKYSKTLRNPDGSKITYAQFQDIMSGDSPIRNYRKVVPGSEGGKYTTGGPDMFVADGSADLLRLRGAIKAAAQKGAEKGFTETRNVILSTPDTPLGQKMKLVTNALAQGTLNFEDETGAYSFNRNDFSRLVAEGKVQVQPLMNPVNGMPGFQMTITNDDGSQSTVTGNVHGLENQTWFKDLAVDLDLRSENQNISKAKGDQLKSLSNLVAGYSVAATDAAGNDIGVGSLMTQINDKNPELAGQGDMVEDIKLNNGLSMDLKANGQGLYRPLFYSELNGVKTPINPNELESLPKGNMSLENIIEYVGQFNKPARNK